MMILAVAPSFLRVPHRLTNDDSLPAIFIHPLRFKPRDIEHILDKVEETASNINGQVWIPDRAGYN